MDGQRCVINTVSECFIPLCAVIENDDVVAQCIEM